MKIYIKSAKLDGDSVFEWTDEKGRELKVSGVGKTKEEIKARAKRMFHTEDIELVSVLHF